MSDRRGFALILVVLLLFAVGMLGAVGYQMVQTEASMSLTDAQGSRAFMAAQAGLERFMAEQNSPLPDEVTYTVQDARAVVVPTLLYDGPYPNQTWQITSVGTYLDPRFPGNSAERTVSQLVILKRVPVNLLGAFGTAAVSVSADGDDLSVDGRDQATPLDCSVGGLQNVAGIVAAGGVNVGGGTAIRGSPSVETIAGSEPFLDSLGANWDALTDASRPVDFQDSWPDFVTLPADSFPIIRYSGSLIDVGCRSSGRGLLIVEGTMSLGSNSAFDLVYCGLVFGVDRFTWDGLILASNASGFGLDGVPYRIEGAFMEGFDASGGVFALGGDGEKEILYDSCSVLKASQGVAHLDPLPGTWWEVR